MKNKKNMHLIFGVIFIVLIGVIYYKNPKKNDDVRKNIKSYQISLIDNKLDAYLKETKLGYTIKYTSENIIKGILVNFPDEDSEDIYGTTAGYFTYNVSEDKFSIKYNDFKIFASDFVEKNNNIYYLESFIDEKDSEYFSWNFIKSNIDFTKKEILLSGKHYLFATEPKVIFEKDNAYLFTLVDEVINDSKDLINQEYKLYKIIDSGLKEIFSESYKNTKDYITSSWDVTINNDNFYYSTKNNNYSSKIYKINVFTLKKEIIYEKTDNVYSLYSFEVFGDNLAIVKLNSSENSLFEIYNDKEVVFSQKDSNVSNIYKVSKDKMLFVTRFNSYIYNSEYNKLFQIKNSSKIPIRIRNYAENRMISLESPNEIIEIEAKY